MVTRDDVARRAGVSGATVSYVLNDTDGASISEETRRAVLEAAREIGYRPSLLGRALRAGRLEMLGVVGPAGDVLFGTFHRRVLRGLWDETSSHNYRLVVDSRDEEGQIALLEERVVDGVAFLTFTPTIFDENVRANLEALGLPAVLIGGGAWAEGYHTVDVDNEALGQEAGEHLLGMGHRDIGYLGPPPESVTSMKRHQGFLNALAEAGLSPGQIPHREVDLLDPEAQAGGILEEHPELTAVFCFNDTVARALMHVAKGKGLRLPDELSILGVDNARFCQLSHPPLSSIALPTRRMGEEAARILLDSPSEPVHRYFPFELVERESVKETH